MFNLHNSTMQIISNYTYIAYTTHGVLLFYSSKLHAPRVLDIVIAKTCMRFRWAICFALCPDHIYNSHNECSSGLQLLTWAPAISLDIISTVCIDTSPVDASFNDAVYFDTVAFSLFRQVRGTSCHFYSACRPGRVMWSDGLDELDSWNSITKWEDFV